ncbi:TorF family putative porin [Methyloversatilis thermotolerans]|uniref:TorF family putative porin n=1 Tax=Methyloversatilis thermotolerans TaxID=1346290 RepID=UPI00037D50CF|nr:TorF family putative porin [Methyloversatilis thermotolerans]
MQKTLIAAALASALAVPSFSAMAEEPASPHTFTGNVGLFSQYVFRGLSQTNEDVALQGGFDYSHASGFYVGTWASNISWLEDFGAYQSSSLEVDVYGGYRGAITDDITYDVGVLQYLYPGSKFAAAVNPNTTEIYGALAWKWLSAKYSYAVTDAFGVDDSNGTWYLDLSAAYPITDKLTLNLHYGIQEFDGRSGLCASGKNDDCASYEDWKIGLAYALPQSFTVGVFYTDTSMNRQQTTNYTPTSTGKFIGDEQYVVFLSKTF